MNEKLLKNIQNAIQNTIPQKKIGIAFSGGVDSTLISKICNDMGYDITLLTIGFSGSHDLIFAKEVNAQMNFKHHISEIDTSKFFETTSKIANIIKTDNLSWQENCIAFYYVSKLAQDLKINVVVTANGIDELFCGYNNYRTAFSGGYEEIMRVMNSKIENEIKMMKAVNQIASEFNVTIIQPLLSEKFIEYARTIPISEKIHGSDDLLRKHAIRELAKEIGVPSVSYSKRKKALQYGSKIHKELLKFR